MANIEDAPRLRELCEKASKEYDHDKLLDLVRQINDLLEREQIKSPGKNEQKPSSSEEKKASPTSWAMVARNRIVSRPKSGLSSIGGFRRLEPKSISAFVQPAGRHSG